MRLSSVVPAVTALLLGGASALSAQKNPYDSGGPLIPEQAAFDVLFYDLALEVHPSDSTIRGSLTMTARIVTPTEQIVLDLAPEFEVYSVDQVTRQGDARSLSFARQAGEIWIDLPSGIVPGVIAKVVVAYGGKAERMNWGRTPTGEPWITTSVEMSGADVWWPVKDHSSDEPDSLALHITVPAPLVVASNGRLRDVTEEEGDVRTYHWFVSTPINNYGVALNIAPYRTIEKLYMSVTGETIPVTFWVIPQSMERGREFVPEILDHLRFFEEVAGPYPFRADKYGVAETPYLGMEHQTIIAYGADFDNGAMTQGVDFGFDALHQHELAHEWYGNLVTAADWKDLWLHEGFASYMQPLYLESRQGMDAYRRYMDYMRPQISNAQPVASRETQSARGAMNLDIYFKGAWILHTLRYLIGEDAFRMALRRLAYPDPAMEGVTDGRQTWLATTEDFIDIAEATSGEELGWFFEVYVRLFPATSGRVGERRCAARANDWG
jgi:aminopeptidase N